MGMENENVINPVEKPKPEPLEIKPEDGHHLEGTERSASNSSSPLASPSSSSSSSSFEDQSLNPDPHSPTPASSTPQWSMMSASPSYSTRLSELYSPIPSPQPGAYDPNRIPMAIFGSRSNAPQEWSVASTESLFSIHMGNNSFSREQALLLMNKSGELGKLEDNYEEKRSGNNDNKSFSSTLPTVIEGAHDNEETGENGSVSKPKHSPEDVSKIAASSEIHSFALSANSSDVRGGTPPALNPPRLSDGSGTSSSSFAFPLLVNENGNGSSLKSVPEKQETEEKQQPGTESQTETTESSKEATAAADTSWFSYFFFWRRCC